MTKPIRIRAIRRREIDEDKLVLAFLLLAKRLHEPESSSVQADVEKEVSTTRESSAAQEAA